MKKLLPLVICILLISCGGVSTEDCNNDVRAYEFGREMHAMSYTGRGLSETISEARKGYSNMGLSGDHYFPYSAKNACVKRGWEDANSGKNSPYNKSRQSWRKF